MTRHLSHLESIHSAGTFASTAALKAVAVSGLINNTWSYVESEGEYYYDSASFEAESLPDIIQPASGTGRWYKKKVTAVSPNNILKLLAGKVNLSGGILTGSLTLASDPSSSLQAATKQYVDNAVQTVSGSVSALVSDAAFSSAWDGSLAVAPSRNALYDKIVTLFANGGNAFGADAALGTSDAFALHLKSNNTVRLSIDPSGKLISQVNLQFAGTHTTSKAILDESGNKLLEFSSASGATNYIQITNIGANPQIKAMGGANAGMSLFTSGTGMVNIPGMGLILSGTTPYLLGSSGGLLLGNYAGSQSATSGVARILSFSANSSVITSSGTASFNLVDFNHTINQTGTANGKVRGIYYNPTVASVLGTHNAIETTSGNVVFGGGTLAVMGPAASQSQFSLGNGTTTYYMGTDATTNAAGVANAFWIGNTFNNALVYLTSSVFSSRPSVSILSGSGIFYGLAGAQGAAGTNYDAVKLNNSTGAIPQPTSGAYNAVTIGVGTNQQFAPSSGNATYTALSIRPTISQTGTANGIIRGIYYNPALTSVPVSHYAFEAVSGMVKIGAADVATSPSSGALQVVGGAGIGGGLYAAGNIVFTKFAGGNNKLITADATGNLTATNEIVPLGVFVQNSTVTLNARGETSIHTGSIVGSTTLNATGHATNPQLIAGKTYRYKAAGTFAAGATPDTVRIKVKLGTTVLVDTNAVTLSINSFTGYFEIEFLFSVVTQGSTGTVRVEGTSSIVTNPANYSASRLVQRLTTGTDVTVDTTSSRIIDVVIDQQQNGGASNTGTFSINMVTLEYLN